MGMVFADVMFQDRAPPLSDICTRITDICSLPVVVLESNADEMHDLDATIAFECVPDIPLEILVYRPGAVVEFCDDTFDEPTLSSFMKNIVQGVNEPAGTQTVYLRGYIGQEPTLMITTELALESLGGTSSHAMADDDRQEYGKPISESELKERYRKTERQMRRLAFTTVAMLPLLIPMWILGCVWSIIMSPFRIWQGYCTLNAFERNEKGSG